VPVHSKLICRGFTIIELIVAIAVLAILLTIGVPSIQQLIKNNRVTAQTNELVSMINFARNESIRRNDTVTVNLTKTTNGWSGEVKDPGGTGSDPCTATGALRCADYNGVQLPSGTDTFAFNNRGYVDGFSQVEIVLQHTDCAGDRQRREITILPTGQVSSTDAQCL
jgi:type IV fimbrial biogenesis protein FimT